MKIQKKALAAIAEITNELGDQFDELRAEIDRRFGERRSEGEVFRPLPAPQGMDMSVLTALNERRSQRNFSNEPLPDQLLSNILYAADGIKLQSVYLAAAAMNLACVARTGFRTDKISAALHLKPDEVVIAAQSLGFPAKSILDHLK